MTTYFSHINQPTNYSDPPLPLQSVPLLPLLPLHPSLLLLPNSLPPANNTQTTQYIKPIDITKQISEIAKIYIEEQKYDRSNSSLDHKYTIFINIC